MAHLLQVDVERVVRGVGRDGARGFFFGVLDLLAVGLDLVLVEELDIEIIKDVHDVLDQLRVGGAVGNDLIDVLDRDVTVLLGKTDQLLDLLVDVAADHRVGDWLGRYGGLGQCLRDGHGLGGGSSRLGGGHGFAGRGGLHGRLGFRRWLGDDGLHGRLRRGRGLSGRLGGSFDNGLGLLGGFDRLVGGLLVLLVGHLGKIRRR